MEWQLEIKIEILFSIKSSHSLQMRIYSIDRYIHMHCVNEWNHLCERCTRLNPQRRKTGNWNCNEWLNRVYWTHVSAQVNWKMNRNVHILRDRWGYIFTTNKKKKNTKDIIIHYYYARWRIENTSNIDRRPTITQGDSTQGRIRDEIASNEHNLFFFSFFFTFYLLEQRTCGKMVIKRNRVDTLPIPMCPRVKFKIVNWLRRKTCEYKSGQWQTH